MTSSSEQTSSTTPGTGDNHYILLPLEEMFAKNLHRVEIKLHKNKTYGEYVFSACRKTVSGAVVLCVVFVALLTVKYSLTRFDEDLLVPFTYSKNIRESTS